MQTRFAAKLGIAVLLYLPVSAGFVYFGEQAQKYVNDEYVTTSFAEVAQLRGAMESEWDTLERQLNVWGNSQLIAPTRSLETITATLQGFVDGSTLVRNASVLGVTKQLVASTSNEFLLYGADNKGLHPGIRQWPVDEALAGESRLNIGSGSYESYYLVPINDPGGNHHGVLAIELTFEPFQNMARGFLGRWNLGVGVRHGDMQIVSDPQIPSGIGEDLTWTDDGNKLLMTVPFTDAFMKSSQKSFLTVVRNWAPIRSLQNRISVFTFGFSSLVACLFFVGIVIVASKTKSVPTATVSTDFDVKIRTSDHGQDPGVDVVVDKDRMAS